VQPSIAFAPCASLLNAFFPLPVATLATDSRGSAWLVLLIYSLIIAAGTLIGGWWFNRTRLSHTAMQMLLSFVGGLILGIAVFHLWPHSLHSLGPRGADRAAIWTMVGMVAMFLLLRMFHFHDHGQHHPADQHVCRHGHIHQHDHSHAHAHAHADRHAHADHRSHLEEGSSSAGEPKLHSIGMQLGSQSMAPSSEGPTDHAPQSSGSGMGWIGVFFGLSIHTLLDGAALGASIAADSAHAHGSMAFGIGTFVAIALHKPLDALTILSMMKASGVSARNRLAVVAVFALMCPIGAALFWQTAHAMGEHSSIVIGCALAASAGIFICISLGDLLPEMEFHAHNRWTLTALLLLGIALAWSLRFLEPSGIH
jgi:zinc and cadmium transporter